MPEPNYFTCSAIILGNEIREGGANIVITWVKEINYSSWYLVRSSKAVCLLIHRQLTGVTFSFRRLPGVVS